LYLFTPTKTNSLLSILACFLAAACSILIFWNLTNELIEKALIHIKEIDNAGGMIKAIQKGIPKMRIEQAAAKKQAKIDNKEFVLVGVNKYKLEKEEEINFLEIDNKQVRNSQISRLSTLKNERNEEKVKKILEEIYQAAKNKNKNLLDLSVRAAKVRATIGEISSALEKAFGRYKSEIRSFTGVYKSKMKDNKSYKKAVKISDEFAEMDGRRARILIAKIGQDGHDRGAKVVATSFADIGFDIDMGPLFQSPKDVAKDAVENDVHAIGVSTLAAGHKTLVPELMNSLKELDPPTKTIILFSGSNSFNEFINSGTKVLCPAASVDTPIACTSFSTASFATSFGD
jgi:methylmalonyl-CoA mutase